MKFVKLRLRDVPEKDTVEQWRLLIDNTEDLLKYKGLDIGRYTETFLQMAGSGDLDSIRQGTHVGGTATRELAIASYITNKINTTPETEKVYPILALAELIDKKTASMLKCINLYGAICINEAGGFCDLKTFLNIWNGEVLETLEKEGLGFPVDGEAMQCDTLILENASADFAATSYFIEGSIAANFPNSKIGVINNLKEIDERYVFKCICNAKNIAISTQALDDAQVDSFVKLFIAVPTRKNVLIRTTDEGKAKITSNTLFGKISHNIIFEKF